MKSWGQVLIFFGVFLIVVSTLAIWLGGADIVTTARYTIVNPLAWGGLALIALGKKQIAKYYRAMSFCDDDGDKR